VFSKVTPTLLETWQEDVEDHGTLLQDELADGRSRVVV